ncbi:hypothetical protein BH23VER1_BH23VER1_32370 [soil metagenome]
MKIILIVTSLFCAAVHASPLAPGQYIVSATSSSGHQKLEAASIQQDDNGHWSITLDLDVSVKIPLTVMKRERVGVDYAAGITSLRLDNGTVATCVFRGNFASGMPYSKGYLDVYFDSEPEKPHRVWNLLIKPISAVETDLQNLRKAEQD